MARVSEKNSGQGPKVLAIETSSRVGSLALAVGTELVAVLTIQQHFNLQEMLPEMLEEV